MKPGESTAPQDQRTARQHEDDECKVKDYDRIGQHAIDHGALRRAASAFTHAPRARAFAARLRFGLDGRSLHRRRLDLVVADRALQRTHRYDGTFVAADGDRHWA